MPRIRKLTRKEESDRKLMLSRIRTTRMRLEEGKAHRMMIQYRKLYWENPNPPKSEGASTAWGVTSKKKKRRRRRRRSS